MIATKMLLVGGMHLVLVFDDGVYAVHQGMFVWTIFSSSGTATGQFDVYTDGSKDYVTRGIKDYCHNHPDQLGRVA